MILHYVVKCCPNSSNVASTDGASRALTLRGAGAAPPAAWTPALEATSAARSAAATAALSAALPKKTSPHFSSELQALDNPFLGRKE